MTMTSQKTMAECFDRAQGFEFYQWLSGRDCSRDALDGLMSWAFRPEPARLNVYDDIIAHFLGAFPELEGKVDPFEKVYALLDRGPEKARFDGFVLWLEAKGARKPGKKVDHNDPNAPYSWAWHVLQRMLRGGPAHSTRADDEEFRLIVAPRPDTLPQSIPND